MAANDIKVLKSKYGTEQFRTEANVLLGMAAGDGMMVGGTGTNYATLVLDATPARGTNVFIGISENSSSATAAGDGVINVQLVGPGTILQAKAHTAANINTDAKLLAILNDCVTFSRSAATVAGILTINETGTAGKSSTNPLVIISGDIVKGTLRCAVQTGFFASNI